MGVRAGGAPRGPLVVQAMKGVSQVIDTFGGMTSESQGASELSKVMADKIYAAAQPGAVFSAPVVSFSLSRVLLAPSSRVTPGGSGLP